MNPSWLKQAASQRSLKESKTWEWKEKKIRLTEQSTDQKNQMKEWNQIYF